MKTYTNAIAIIDSYERRAGYLSAESEKQATTDPKKARTFATRKEAIEVIARLKATPLHFSVSAYISMAPCKVASGVGRS